MDRTARIMTGLDKSMLGIEVAPWIAPIAPKAAGYNVRVMDVFDRPTLMARAVSDPDYGNRDTSPLEEVDYVGSATQIASSVPVAEHGTFDYIVSSHNFEHLPNPIKFLHGCQKLLKPGGILSMAVPDRRSCFDYFRPNTQLGDWLDAFVQDRDRPTPRQVFDLKSQVAYLQKGDKQLRGFAMGVSREAVMLEGDLLGAFKSCYQDTLDDTYQDSHCTVMSPASLELLLVETRQLGLVDFRILEISEPNHHEFYVRLQFGALPQSLPDADFKKLRQNLLRRILKEYGPQAVPYRRDKSKGRVNAIARRVRSFGRKLRGQPDH